MTFPRDSLGGQNSHGRVSGARSSRALSAIFKKLQKIDRDLRAIDLRIKIWGSPNNQKLLLKRKKLDEKRKNLRMKRKRYLES